MLIKLLIITTSDLLEIASEIDKLLGLQSVSPSIIRKYAASLCFIVAVLLMIFDYNDNRKTNYNDNRTKENKSIKAEHDDIIVVEEVTSPISVTSSTATSSFSPYSNMDLSFNNRNSNNNNFDEVNSIFMDSDNFISSLVVGILVWKVKATQNSYKPTELKTYKLTGKGFLISEKTGIFNQLQQHYKLSRLNNVSLEDKNDKYNNNDFNNDKNKNNKNNNNLSLLLMFVGKSNKKSLEIKAENNEMTTNLYNGFISIMKRTKFENNRKWFKANIADISPGSVISSKSSSISSTPVSLSRSNSLENFGSKNSSNSKLTTLVEEDPNDLTPISSPDCRHK